MVSACNDAPPAPGLPNEEPAVASVEITPRDLRMLEGTSEPLAAVARDSLGAVLPAASMRWSARPSDVVLVSPDGVVEAVALGTGHVTVASGTATDTVAVEVRLQFEALSAGAAHTCAVTSAGRAYCWGWNREGRLGIGVRSPIPVPQRVAATGYFEQVSAGWEVSCGTLRGGAACWGSNRSGQLGSLTKTDALAPVPVVEGGSFVRIATHGTHSCALADREHTVWCWGAGWTGQRGTGTLASGQPAPVASTLAFRAVDVGWLFTCGIGEDGIVRCWGSNRDGELGCGSAPDSCTWADGSRYPCALLPVPVAAAVRFDTLAAGTSHACALATDGTAFCWGRNDAGQLGIGSTEPVAIPTAVAGPGPFAMVSAGDRHTCALDADGVAWCWGNNDQGALGRGTTGETCDRSACATVPVRVETMLRFRSIAASRAGGGAHTCGLTADGTAYCWGSNALGQLGIGPDRPGGAEPQKVAGQLR
jgi:alpha-tubulin suppressor-like RCC1 family protein